MQKNQLLRLKEGPTHPGSLLSGGIGARDLIVTCLWLCGRAGGPFLLPPAPGIAAGPTRGFALVVCVTRVTCHAGFSFISILCFSTRSFLHPLRKFAALLSLHVQVSKHVLEVFFEIIEYRNALVIRFTVKPDAQVCI